MEHDSSQAMGRLGVEIWRLGGRIEAGRTDRLDDSYQRLLEVFAELGGRIDDRSGERFIEGTAAEILSQPDGVDPGAGTLIWSETVRPGIYLDGQCVVIPQVMLNVREETADGDSAAHD
jgi:hypothetical protein